MRRLAKRQRAVRDANTSFEAWLLEEFAQQADCALAPDQLDDLTARVDEEFAKASDASFANTLRHLEQARERLGRRSSAA